MKKIISTLFLASVLAITATSTIAQTGGQIPIGGKSISVPYKTTAATIVAADLSENEMPAEVSGYFWSLMNIIKQVKF